MTQRVDELLGEYRMAWPSDPSKMRLRREQVERLLAEGAPKLGRIVTPCGETYAYDGIPVEVTA